MRARTPYRWPAIATNGPDTASSVSETSANIDPQSVTGAEVSLFPRRADHQTAAHGRCMRRLPPGASVVAALVAAVVLVGGGLIPRASAANADPSNVVLVLDFSASILEDATTRNRFAAALRRIAARGAALSRRVHVPAPRRGPRRQSKRRSKPRRRRGAACARLARRADRRQRLGPSAVAVEPVFRQRHRSWRSRSRPDADKRFERKLYMIRKRVEHAVDAMDLADRARSTCRACRRGR